MQPLAVILEQELMASWGILEGNNKHGTWTVDSHTSSSLVTSGDSSQLVSWPDSEDGSDREVGVDNGGSIQWIKCDGESISSHVKWLRNFLRACKFAASRVTESFKQELVGQQVHCKLLISERVDTGSGSAGSSANLESDGSNSLRHGHHKLSQLGVTGGFHQELLKCVPHLGVDTDSTSGSFLGCSHPWLLSHGLNRSEEVGSDGLGLHQTIN